MYDPVSRREFLQRALLAGTATAVGGSTLLGSRPAKAARPRSPNERLNLAVIGVAAQGGYNLGNVTSENIVALCDIDSQRLGPVAMKLNQARTYDDYRVLLDKEKDLDAVVVSTPDHSHAMPVIWALRRGLDVYCEKPLAHSVWEVRQMRELAAAKKAVTQMGTQIHAGDNYRRAVEIVQAGVLGPVRQVHVWQTNSVRPGHLAAAGTMPPAHVNYDQWVGPAPMRPFDESHFHFNWRYWWDFGGGILADMGCHYIDLPFWALGLRYPTSVEAHGEKTYEGDNDVPNNLRVEYEFAERESPQGKQPPVKLTWYHGTWKPEGAEVYAKGAAVLFEGDRGRLLADYGSHQLFMNEGEQATTPPASIPSSIGHHAEWIAAVKSRGETTCNFDYSGALAETVLLGNVSYRAGQERLQWDAEKLAVTNLPKANDFIRREYRAGWSLDG